MKLKVNRTTIEVFEGAEIRHALLTYLTRRRMSLKYLEKLEIRDIWGHEVALDAPASAFTQIRLNFKE
jgi:hypothetical protein